MELYLSLLVPLLAMAVCALVPQFKHKVAWWEMILPFIAWGVIAVPTILLSKAGLTHDTEYLTFKCEEARYYEDWNERVACTHAVYRTETYTVMVNGKAQTRTRQVFSHWAHPYDVDYHREHWKAYSSSGKSTRIKEDHYNQLVKKFGKPKFKDLHRKYHTNDGDMYHSDWDGSDESLEPYTEERSYENRVQTDDGGAGYMDLTEEEILRVHEYPLMWKNYRSHGAINASGDIDERIMFWNAKLGKSKHVRIWLIVFDDLDRQLGFLQEAFWKGGNKNEIVICLGMNGEEPAWSHVFSWTEIDTLKVELRDIAFENGPTIEMVDKAAAAIEAKYEMVDWSKFDYIDINAPLWAVLLAFFLTTAASGGAIWWSIHNEHDEGDPVPWAKPAYRRRRSRSFTK